MTLIKQLIYCRKQFLFSLIFLFTLSSCSLIKGEKHFKVMQGVTSKKFTSFNIISDTDEDISLKISQGIKLIPNSLIKIEKISNNFIPANLINKVSVNLRNLDTEFNHDEEFTLEIKSSKFKEVKSFYLKDITDQKNMAITSCMNDHYEKEQRTIWSNLLKLSPDMIFMIGDNSYVDHGLKLENGSAPELLWKRYLETRENLKIFNSNKLIPIAMIWDDHDYGFNNGGKDYIHKEEATKVFKAFSQNENLELTNNGPGIAWSLTGNKRKFIFFDNRSFRDNDDKKDGFHFGREQMNWFKNELKDSPDKLYLVSGDQFQGAYHRFESFEGNHPEKFIKFKKTLRSLSANKGKNITLISGDRHISEIQSVKDLANIFEITSSPIHSSLVAKELVNKSENPNRSWVLAGEHNYAILNTKKDTVNFYSLKSQTNSIKEFKLAELPDLD
ncbi:MAG: alkaline phosphatase family protein [Candidatus Caenarcaniphilales bacterium]|nr:alkaline phosphatase family protein [Candidatus Caenarcaniphilales bacterium]